MLVTRDSTLLDEVLRLAAAAGVAPVAVSRPEELLPLWSAAGLVLVGVDVAAEVAALQPGRRDGVHLLALGNVADRVFAVALALGAETVSSLPRSEGWLVEALTDAGDQLSRQATVVGVVAGSGGAGATTFACALGQAAARSGSALVVDADPLGPGLDRVLGLEDHDGVRWDALVQTTGRLSARSLHDAVPRRGRLGALTWSPGGPRGSLPAFALRETLSAARRGHDVVVLDLPRGSGEVMAELAARCDLLILVVVPRVTGVAAAVRVAQRWSTATRTHLLVRGHGVALRDIERATALPAAFAMSDQRGLDEAVDLGCGPVRSWRGPLGRAAGEVLAAALAPEAPR